MKDPEAKRKWRFYAEDWDDAVSYIDSEGRPIDRDACTVSPFIGTAAEASKEADRRADLWEDHPDCNGVNRIVTESLGRVREGVSG